MFSCFFFAEGILDSPVSERGGIGVMADAGILPTSRELRGPGGSALALSSLGSPKKQRGPGRKDCSRFPSISAALCAAASVKLGSPFPPDINRDRDFCQTPKPWAGRGEWQPHTGPRSRSTSGRIWSPAHSIPGLHYTQWPSRRELAAVPRPRGAAEGTHTLLGAWSSVPGLSRAPPAQPGGERDWSRELSARLSRVRSSHMNKQIM